MKILFLQILFIFSQLLSSVFPLNSLEQNDLVYLNDYLKQNQKLTETQKGELQRALTISAGIDNKLSELEWKSFLKINPTIKFNSSYSDSLQLIDQEFKQNSKIKHGFVNKLYLGASYQAAQIFDKAPENYHLIVYGNELTSVAVVVMASRALVGLGVKPKVLLIRKNKPEEPFGGLLVQGGLAYLDRNQINANLTPSSEFYREFLKRAKVKRIAANPHLVSEALKTMLLEANVHILHESVLEPAVIDNQIKYLKVKNLSDPKKTTTLQANSYADTSQDAELARAAGLKYSIGFQSLGFPGSTLPVSPVFRTKGLTVQELQKIEKQIIANPYLMKKIKEKLYAELDKDFADWLLKKAELPFHVGEDFVDFRSIALGAAYHLYRNKPYDFKKGFLFDRPNIAILSKDELSWNALLYKFTSYEVLEMADAGSRPTEEMLSELKELEKWLNSFGVSKQIKVIAPQELYVRQSLNILDVKEPLSGQIMLHGGLSPEKAVGTFCYYFDARGGIEGLGGKMPKPTFNFGIEHSLTKISNLAVVGRSAGYTGLAPTAGRILEINVSVGSFIAAAAAIVTHENRSIYSVTSKEARALVERITGVPVLLQGKDLSKEFKDSRII
ncbi:MAG: FAD-dependent oxidoreductase [Candidatus Caenarcaniphilales bacterium]|nr:FAD-dependent oxidoreductase [Candidatus Caenarcaniphilales bacterium]